LTDKIISIKSGEFLFERVTTSATKKPAKPQIKLLNPFDDPSAKMMSLGLIPDATFQTNGIIEIHINRRKLLGPTKAADFTDISDINLPIPDIAGLLFEPGESIEVFVWASSGTVGIAIGAFVGVD